MPSKPSAEKLLLAIAKAGYFANDGADQDLFRRVAERDLNTSVERAIDVLTGDGLVTFSHDTGPSVHPKDRLDLWRLDLTSHGRNLLFGSGFAI